MKPKSAMWLLCLLVILAPVLRARQATKEKLPDPDGNYRWKYVDSSGTEREFVFEPATKVAPSVALTIATLLDGSYQYNYAISNGSTARQKIYSISVEVAVPTKVTGGPVGWAKFQPLDIAPRAAWFKAAFGEPLDGISPGSVETEFQLSSTALPGITEFKFVGNANEFIGAPEDAPSEIDEQLDYLRGKEIVIVRALGPVIARPADPPAIVLRRIVRSYRTMLLLSSDSRTMAILRGLDEAIKADSKDEIRAVLSGILSLLSSPEPSSDKVSGELIHGLSLCLTHVLRQLNSQTP